MITKIISPKNDLIKDIVNLQTKSKERKTRGITLIEGAKEISVARDVGVKFEKVLFFPQIIDEQKLKELIGNQFNQVELFELGEDAFAKISYRESTGGVVVIAKTPDYSLNDLIIKDNSFFIVLESVEKPGNLGAICRIADAAGAAGVIICDGLTDVYNPNSVRASLGCVFSVKVVNTSTENVLDWMKLNNIKSYAAELTASEFYHKYDLLGKTAVVFGTEATGLSQKWISAADKRIKIPMLGIIDSLNVSASVAIVTFEAMRQRDFLV
jgi:RNA methyltransferase, TrmH family